MLTPPREEELQNPSLDDDLTTQEILNLNTSNLDDIDADDALSVAERIAATLTGIHEQTQEIQFLIQNLRAISKSGLLSGRNGDRRPRWSAEISHRTASSVVRHTWLCLRKFQLDIRSCLQVSLQELATVDRVSLSINDYTREVIETFRREVLIYSMVLGTILEATAL